MVKCVHNVWWSPDFGDTFSIERITQSIRSHAWPKPSASFIFDARHFTKFIPEGTLHNELVIYAIVLDIFLCFHGFKNMVCNTLPDWVGICRWASERSWNSFLSEEPNLGTVMPHPARPWIACFFLNWSPNYSNSTNFVLITSFLKINIRQK